MTKFEYVISISHSSVISIEIKKDVEEEEAAKLDYSEVKGIKDTTSQPQTMNVEMNMDETDHSTNPEVNHESTKKENQKNPGKSYLSSIIHHKIDLIEVRWCIHDLIW